MSRQGVQTVGYSEECDVCRLLFKQFSSSPVADNAPRIRSLSYLDHSPWGNDGSFLEACDSALLSVEKTKNGWTILSLVEADFNRVEVAMLGEKKDQIFFCKRADENMNRLLHAQPVLSTWDAGRSRSWLETCVQCRGSSNGPVPTVLPGMNLIDCDDMVIVAAQQGFQWLALSYVWGSNHQTAATDGENNGFRPGAHLPADAAATIRDAITVTKRLGYRYLWVDEYCIDQSSEIHKRSQIKKMDRIYQGAILTIVAAAGNDKAYGLPGVGARRKGRPLLRIGEAVLFTNGPEPDIEARSSKWFSRAW